MRLWPVRKFVIKGCESRGDVDSPYLTRYILPRIFVRPMLHIFHRSDADEHHDHPWPFVTIILWRGYIEETACPECSGLGSVVRSEWPHQLANHYQESCPACDGAIVRFKRRIWPGQILYRRTTHRHRVILVGGKPAITLVITGRRCREWGFFTKQGWQNWREYFDLNGCGKERI